MKVQSLHLVTTRITSFIILAFMCLSFLSMPLEAKKLYKFQDAQGKWHYTDKAPDNKLTTELNVQVRQLKVEAKRRVWLKNIGKKNHPEFVLRNDFSGPIEVKIFFTKKTNTQAFPTLPSKFVVLPGTSEPLLKLESINKYKGWGYSLEYHYLLGAPSIQHNESAVYIPPIASYKKVKITQAFNGKFSHTNGQNKYAVDLAMPEGSRVHAARAGVVMSVRNDFFKGGVDKQAYKSRANSIRILHDDGSMAVYSHLQVERAQVHEGMHVKAGQIIAYSGNTGFSTGPHLHFAVQVNNGMNLVAVPFRFTDKAGNAAKPQRGQWLSGFAVH